MLNEPTMEKLQGACGSDAMAARLAEQQQQAATLSGLSFDERLGLLVDAEWLHRENKRLERALARGEAPLAQACIEDIDYAARRELDKAVVRQLASCRWVEEHQNVIITGHDRHRQDATSRARSRSRRAARATARMYRRASRLFDELALARADGTYPRLLARLARVDVLVHRRLRDRTRHRRASGATSSRSSKTATAPARRSSPASSRRRSGTTTSPTRPSPTPSATASSTTPTASC